MGSISNGDTFSLRTQLGYYIRAINGGGSAIDAYRDDAARMGDVYVPKTEW